MVGALGLYADEAYLFFTVRRMTEDEQIEWAMRESLRQSSTEIKQQDAESHSDGPETEVSENLNVISCFCKVLMLRGKRFRFAP